MRRAAPTVRRSRARASTVRFAARRRATAAALACGALAACSFSRPTPETRYYTLTVPGRPATHLDGAVKVGIFTADQPYATERFAYRSSPYALEYYTYHRW